MKILILTDHYYPDIHGGYEVGCSLVAEELMRRGYDVTVLTSDCNAKYFPSRNNIYRILPHAVIDKRFLIIDVLFRFYYEIKNKKILKTFLKQRNFDLVYVWSIRGIFTTSMIQIESLHLPIVYYLFDSWAVDHSGHVPIGWFENMNKYALIKRGLKFIYKLLKMDPHYFPEIKYPQFCSSVIKQQFVKKYGNDSRPIIHFGIQSEKYPFRENKCFSKKLVWLGRPCPEKGFHVAIETVCSLYESNKDVTLDIYGGFDYRQNKYVQELLNQHNNPEYITFHPPVPHDKIPEILSEYDILIFSSMWNEPYGLVPLEAMAAGCVVVSTGDGGSSDYSKDGFNCLLYNQTDYHDCVKKIQFLFDDPVLCKKIRHQARLFIEKEMSFYKTVNEIENNLNEMPKNNNSWN